MGHFGAKKGYYVIFEENKLSLGHFRGNQDYYAIFDQSMLIMSLLSYPRLLCHFRANYSILSHFIELSKVIMSF